MELLSLHLQLWKLVFLKVSWTPFINLPFILDIFWNSIAVLLNLDVTVTSFSICSRGSNFKFQRFLRNSEKIQGLSSSYHHEFQKQFQCNSWRQWILLQPNLCWKPTFYNLHLLFQHSNWTCSRNPFNPYDERTSLR